MNSKSVALFLTTLALAGGTVACQKAPEPGSHKGSDQHNNTVQPHSSAPASGHEGGEGGEGGEGDDH